MQASAGSSTRVSTDIRGGKTDTHGGDRRAQVGALSSSGDGESLRLFLRTSAPVPPPPGTGVTSSPFDPLWGPAPPAFFSVDTNGTGLADATPKDFWKSLMLSSILFFDL